MKHKIYILLTTMLLLSACAPEVGSPKWCKAMKEKSKGDWTFAESKDFLKHCVIK